MCIQSPWLPKGSSDVKIFSIILRNNFFIVTKKQSIIAAVKYSLEDMFAFDANSAFRNVPYRKVHTTETATLSTSCNKRPTAIRMAVRKLCHYFVWCCSQQEGYDDCLFRFLDHTQLDTDTHSVGLFRTSDKLFNRPLHAHKTTIKKDQYKSSYRCTKPQCQYPNSCRSTAQTVQPGCWT